jgi:hypothetical protein
VNQERGKISRKIKKNEVGGAKERKKKKRERWGR